MLSELIVIGTTLDFDCDPFCSCSVSKSGFVFHYVSVDHCAFERSIHLHMLIYFLVYESIRLCPFFRFNYNLFNKRTLSFLCFDIFRLIHRL